MPAPLAATLEAALRDVRTAAALGDVDPLRLDLPPDQVDGATLEPQPAAALGALYLLSELEQVQVVPSAEQLAAERWSLDLRDQDAAAALEAFARQTERWPPEAQRTQLYSRLFGTPVNGGEAAPMHPWSGSTAPVAVAPAPPNAVFEELLAGYCEAILQVQAAAYGRTAAFLRLTGDRLRANLAPRQFGNTLVVAGALVAQLKAALDLLARPAVAGLLQAQGIWGVVRALNPDRATDIGRRLDRGQSGRTLVASCGYPAVPDLVDGALGLAADAWLTATGFDTRTPGP